MHKAAKHLEYLSGFLTGTYLFATFPGLKRHKKWKHLLGWDYAHRGLHDKERGIPENSLAAFQRAVDHHYGIELDVRMTADHHLVIMHDDDLTRMCGIKRNVTETPLAELRTMRLSGTDEKIPLLSEVLQIVAGKVPLIVEIKDEKKDYPALCRLVMRQLDAYRGDYCVESFSPYVVKWLKKNRPEIVRGQLACRPPQNLPINRLIFLLVTHLMTNFLTHPDFIAYKYSDTMVPAFWVNKHLYHVMTVLWTIPDRAVYDHYRRKVDLLIFENFKP